MGLQNMKGYAIAIGALAAVTLVAIAVIGGFGTSNLFDAPGYDTCLGANATTPNCKLKSTSDAFVTGLTVFATFTGVVVLALVGKIIVNLYKEGKR
jgi:hypothetical protein